MFLSFFITDPILQLQAKERQYLKELGDEYKRRDKEQQLLVAKKVLRSLCSAGDLYVLWILSGIKYLCVDRSGESLLVFWSVLMVLFVFFQRTELDKLMEELRKTLTDLEKREKKLAADEQKVGTNLLHMKIHDLIWHLFLLGLSII